MAAISAYSRARAGTESGPALDDRTWNNLNMDEVFSVLDRKEMRPNGDVGIADPGSTMSPGAL